jgi:hypothetical protein
MRRNNSWLIVVDKETGNLLPNSCDYIRNRFTILLIACWEMRRKLRI